MTYKLLFNEDLDEFNREVNEMLSKGWELYGFPFAPVKTFYEDRIISSGYAQAFTGADHLAESAELESAESEDIPF